MAKNHSRKRLPSRRRVTADLLARSGPENLEKRQLLSIAPLITPEERRAVAAIAAEPDTVAAAASSRSLVVIDAGAYGDGGIAGSFDDAVATLVVGQSEDVFAKVEDTLSRVADISAIHLVSHGSPGRFTLGSTRFDAAGVDELGPSLLAWNRLARPGADLYLWGCDIAGGDGASLVDSLYATSGFGIAASTDVTGPAALGGDFDLEYVVGDVAAPRLAAGVDVLWETTLAPAPDHTFTTASKTAMQSAFNRLNDTVAPAISTALAGQTGGTTLDILAQRTVSDLFTDTASVSPADVQTLLELKSAAATYLAAGSPTLSGLAAAINTALAAKATAAGAAAGSRTISVTPSVSGNLVSLQVSIAATGTKLADVDMGTDALPTTWNKVIQTLNSDYGAVFRTTPQLETGTQLTTGFTIQLDLTDPNAPVASLAIATTNLAGGIYSFGPGIRFGILDATLGGQPTLPYSTTVSFGPNGPSRTIANWATPAAVASALGSPSVTIDLPITASINGVSVTSATTKLRISSTDPTGVIPPTITGIDLGRLVWFGNLTSDELINAIKRVGGAYEVLGTNEALTASIPFVQRRSLLDVFAFGDLFDEGIGSVIDVSVPTVMPTEAGSGITFSVTAGGTQLTLTGDKRSDVSVGQSIGLVPSTPTALDAVIRTVTAVTLSGGNTLVTINSTIDGTTTAGSLVPTTPVRPDNLQTLADFQNYPGFAALGISPVYDPVNGTVSLQVATSRSTPVAGQLADDSVIRFTYASNTYEVTVAKSTAANNATFAALVADFNTALATARQVVNNAPAATTVDLSSSYSFSGTLGRLTLTHTGTGTVVLGSLPVPNLLATPAVAFNADPLGNIAFSAGAAAGTTDVKLAFGVKFDIGPGGPIIIGLGGQPVGNGRLPADATITFTSGSDTWDVTVKATDTSTNSSFADLVADFNAARATAQKLVDGTPETNPDRTPKLTDISASFEFFSETVGQVSVRTTGASPTTLLSGQAVPTLTRGRLTADAVFTVTPVGSTGTTVTVSQSSTSTNESIDDLVTDVNSALSSASVTLVTARKNSAGTGIEFFTPTVNSSMPIGIKVTATRTQGNADLGISDGLPSTVTDPITLVGRPSGVNSVVVPHTDTTKKFAETKLDWQLNGLAGTVGYGINTVAFGTTVGDVDATYSAVLAAGGGSAEAVTDGSGSLLTSTFAGAASLDLKTLSRVGAATNDISPSAVITIAVPDLTAELIDSFVDVGAVLSVPGLEDSGRGTGRLSADSKVRFSFDADLYEITVTQATAANNTTFADLVANFNQALTAARKVVNGTPDTTQSYNLFVSGPIRVTGSGGRVSVMRSVNNVLTPLLENLLVPNLAAGGGETGRLATTSSLSVIRGADTYTVTVPASVAANNTTFADLVADFNAAFASARRLLPGQSVPNLAANGLTNGQLATDASLQISRGVDTYTVTVLASATTGNTTFADLVADFNAALQTAQKQTDTVPVTVDARGLLVFSLGQTSGQLDVASIEDASGIVRFAAAGTAGRVQPQSLQEVANPGYADVTIPQPATMGDIGYQSELSVKSIANALTEATRVFDVLERDLKEYTSQEIPLIGQPLGDLIDLNAGLTSRIQAFGKLSASSPEELERGLATSLGVPSADLQIAYDAVRKAYRIDFAYKASKLTTVAFDVDMGVYYELLGKALPKGIDSLTDGDAKTPLSVVINSTSVISVGYDLVNKKTFLYGHDGSSNHGVSNGTSFTITFSVNGQNLQFPAKFGMDVRNGTAQLTNGSLVVELDGPTIEKGFTASGGVLTVNSTTGLTIGMPVAGDGIPAGTTISQITSGTQLTLSNAPSGSNGTAIFRAPASSRYEIFPTANTSERAALNIDSYSATFSGQVRAIMPIFDAFAPANLTAQSSQEMLSSIDNPTLLSAHPASLYLSMPDLGGYLDAVSRLEEARSAITALTSAQKTVDANGIQLGNEIDMLAPYGTSGYYAWRASWRGRLQTAAEDLGGVLFAFAPELENSKNLLGAQESLIDYIRDPAMILDKLNAAIGGVESALKGLDKIPLPFMEGKLGGAVSSIFSFRTGWLLDMRNKMRGAGESLFDVMRQSVFEYLGPKHANILLKYDPVSMDRSLDSMVSATRPEDIGVVFMDKKGEVLSTDVRGADAFEIVFRLGQKVFDTGIDLGFQLDALQSIGIGAAFSGGLRLQVGWEMLLGFGFSIKDGFYIKVDSTGDAGSRGNLSGSTGQFEAQLRFDATLTGASKNYTQRWDAGAGYWKIVDTKGTTVTTDDSDVIDALTGQPYRAIAVNNRATDVTALVATDPTVYDPCGCGDQPAATTGGQKIWWVVGTNSGNGSFVPAELNDQGMYIPQTSPYPHTLIEVTAMKPAQLAGSLFFLRLAATDKIRRGLSGYTDVDSQYFYDASDGPQVTAEQRDNETTGVNRNNDLPTRFSAAVGLNMADPSAKANRFTVRTWPQAPAGAGTQRVVDPFGKLAAGDSGAIAKPGKAWSLAPFFWQESEIPGVYAKEYYAFKLKAAPPAKYTAVDLPVRLATDGNIALRGMGVIDGVQLKVGDRVLVKGQALAEENGIYTVAPGGWTRSYDANENIDFNGGTGKPMFVLVEEGRSNKNTGWNLRDDTGNVTLGTTPLYFERTMVSVRENLIAGTYTFRSVPYQPYITLPILAELIDQQSGGSLNIQVEYDQKNYVITLDPSAGGPGRALRTAQLNLALAQARLARLNAKGEVEAIPDNTNTFNLAQAGYTFVTPTDADKKWYRIEFARLKEVDGVVSRQADRVGTFVDYGTPATRSTIGTAKGWDPIADINADASPGRITWREFRSAGVKNIFQVDFHADAVANLTMELSIGDTASSVNLTIPRIYADFNLDWSTRAARAKVEQTKQDLKDSAQSKTQGTTQQPADDDYSDSLTQMFGDEEEAVKSANMGGDKGIDPSSPLLKEMDLKPEIGFNNIRLDVGSFLTKFMKPIVDEAEPYLSRVRPVLKFFNSRIPVLSDVAGRTIRVVDLLEAYGGPKGKTVRAVIDVVTAVDNLVARIAALPPGVNIQIPMGRFWFPKEFDDPSAINGRAPAPGSKYKYGSLVYDNLALGKRASGYYGGSSSSATADADAKAAIDALKATNPNSDEQKRKQGFISNNAADRGGFRVPLLEDPLNLFQLMMGKTATLVTFQLPKLQYEFEQDIPLLKIICFEVGLRASFEMDANLAFGFDTYGINQYMASGDILDIAQGFYVSDRANADGTGADIAEFRAVASFGLYGGIDLVLAKGGIEGGLRFIGEVNLNDPNNDGKLRLTEAIGLVADTGNPLDLFDLSLRGEVYARYYYKVGLGKLAIKGGKTFARLELFNLVHEGSDGTPIYASRIDGTEGNAVPGTLLLHVGESAAKRVSNQDPLNAKDGAERYKIWNSGETVSVQYLNYSNSITKTWTGVKVVLFEGGLGDDTLDASGLNGIPLIFKGGDGNDSVTLGSGSNRTASRLEGEDGNDTIIVNGGGIVELLGGVGNDIITGGTGLVRIEAGEGNDSITTRAGSMSTIVMAEDYGTDTAVLASTALQNLLDFTTLASAVEFLLDAALGSSVDGTATAGSKNKLTFNVGGVTEIRGSSQDDTFTVRNPRTRDASRLRLGARLASIVSSNGAVPEFEVPFLAADGATTGRLAADSSVSIETDKYTYIVTVPQATAANNFSPSQLVAQFQDARTTAKRVDRSDPSAPVTTVNAWDLFDFYLPIVSEVSGLLLRGGLGDDLYDLTLDNVGSMATDGILIDDAQGVFPATTGAVETCGTCKEIKSIAVVSGGKGYQLPPEVVIVDPTGSGAKATAVLDDEGRVTSIQVIEGGSGYTNPTAFLVAPRSLGDQLVVSSTRPAAELHTPQTTSQISTFYQYTIDSKRVRFVGWGDASRPVGLDQSEVDSVTVNMPEGVLTVGNRINLFQTFTVNTSRMVQNARIVADTIDIETDHGFQVKHPLHAVNSGDVRIRVTANGTNTGEGSDLNAAANRATATAVVSAGGVASLTRVTAGSKYFFTPSITVGADGVTPGTGARFAATLAGNGGGLSGFTQLSPGTGYYTSPAPIVVIPPPASIQIDAMITSSMTSAFGYGDGRGRVLLYADTGMVSTSGEVYFPVDNRPGTPQGARTIDWIGGDFRYRSMVGLDDLVSPTTYPGVSVGTGAAFTATLDPDGRVTGFTKVSGGSGYSQDLPPLVEIEGLATAVPVVGSDGSLTGLRLTYPGDGYGQAPRVTIKPNGFGRVVNSPNGVGSGFTADGVTPMNRAHIRAIGGTLVAVAGAGVGDPLKPIKTDVEKLVAQVTTSGGVHVLEKDGVRIGKDQSVSGITTVNGDVSITTFGGTLELGAPRQAVDEQGRLLWQDAAKTIPIYDRDPVTGRIIYEGGDIRVGSGNVKLTADDVEVNVDLNSSGGTGTITLQPVNMKAEIGLAGTRARVEGVVTNGQLTGFDATKFWGGRGYTTTPLVIVDPAGQRAFASAVVDAGKVTAIDVLFGGTNYDPASPPVVTLTGVTPANQARARAIVGLDGVISGFELLGGTVELGRLKADSAIRFTQGTDTYEVKVTQATAANNNSFADLVADFQAALAVARKVVNGTPNPTQTFNIASQFQFQAGTFGQIGLRHVAVTPAVDILTNYVVPNLDSVGGSGYASAPNVSIASPGQALVQAVLDTANPDPVTGRFSVKEFVVTNPGRNYQSAPYIEVAAPYDFTLDADEVAKFAGKFSQVVIGRIEGQHLFHSPEGQFQGNVVLRAPRAGGTLDVRSFTTTGPVSIIGSGNTFHFDAVGASVSGTSISIDDNVIVHEGVAGTATATTGSIVIFGTGKGMIDGDPTGDDVGDNEDLTLAAQTFVTVTGAIGSRWKLDDLTVTSATRGAIDLQQSVMLTGDLAVTGGAVTIGGVIDVDGDLVIDASSMVLFSSNVHVGGNLIITGATGVTFAGTLTVGGSLSISQVSGTVRFSDLVSVTNPLNVSASTLIEVLGGLMAGDTTTFTANEVEFKGGMASITGTATKTLTVQPFTPSRPVRVGTPMGSASGTLDVSDFDLAAIAGGWGRVVLGDATAGTGAVTVGSIGTQQGSKNSWLANSTTIVGGSVTVVQKVDAANGAGELLLQARTGDVTVNAAVNETATDRSATVSMQAAGAISITAPVSSAQTINLTSGGTTSQTTAGPLATTNLRVDSQGAVSLLSPTNAWSLLAVATSNDDIAIREDSGYEIGSIAGVIGIQVGSATARLTSGGRVTQAYAIDANRLELQGAAGEWVLTAANTIGTLTADTGSLAVSDAAQMNVGSLVASQQTGTAISLSAPTGLSLTAPITTAGGNVVLNNAVTLTTDVVIDVVDGGRTGLVTATSTVDGTTAGQESLTVTGNLSAGGSIGSTTPLESLSVSGDSTFTAGITLRTTGNQTYSGSATSSGTVTIGAADGSTVSFLGDATLGGLVTATATGGTAYNVALTGTSVSITTAMTFANTGSVTLGNQTTDNLLFVNGVTSTAPSTTNLAGTIRTTDANATFGTTQLTANTTVSTGTGDAAFSGSVDSAVGGPSSLAVLAQGTTRFTSAVGGTRPLSQLQTDFGGSTEINGGSVTTTGSAGQSFNDAVSLGATTVIGAASGPITFGSTLDGTYSLTVNTSGMTTFGDDVGSMAALVSLTTDAAGTTTLAGGSIRTSGPGGQVFNDTVVLATNTLLNADAGAISFAGTIDGPFLLYANTSGITTFTGAVGGTTPLAAITTNAGGTTRINGGGITTSWPFGQTFGDAVEIGVLNATFAAGSGPVAFGSTIDSAISGPFAVTVNTTGTTTFGGAVGATRPLASLATNAGGTTAINGGGISTSGVDGQVYGDAVEIGGTDAILAAAAGPVTFSNTVNAAVGGPFALTVNSTGTTTFGGAVGATRALTSLTTNAGGSTRLGGNVTTSGPAGQSYGDAVVLTADAALNAAAGGISFASNLDGAFNLAVNTTGSSSFGKAIGDIVPLASLTTDAGGTATIAGGLAKTSGTQTWRDTTVTMPVNTSFISSTGSILAGQVSSFSALTRDVSFTAATGIGAPSAPILLAAAQVTAEITGGTGGIYIVGIGDLVIGSAGLTAPGVIGIDASGQIRVPDGGRIVGAGGVTAGKPVRWSVTGTDDAGPVSLRQILSNANTAGVEGVVVFSGSNNVFRPATPLPVVTTRVTIDGTGAGVVLDGQGGVATGLSLAAAAAGSTIRGVTVRNFADNGIVLDGAAGTTVQGCVIQANGNGLRAAGTLAGASIVGNTFTANAAYGIHLYGASGLSIDGNTVRGVNTSSSMGLYATGSLSGTVVTRNVFSGGLRGVLLDGARSLTFGQIGRGNTLSDNISAPNDPRFSGTGLRAQGDCRGSVVTGNLFTRNNLGLGFVNAQNLVARQNTFTQNRVTGIYVEGNNLGSTQTGSVFGTRTDKNKANIVRFRGSRGV